MLSFSYDDRKARSNLRKHGVSFEEAETVFLDLLAITIPDEAHSAGERREITLGYSQGRRMLLVVHTEEVDDEIRIISALKADAYERRQYPHAPGFWQRCRWQVPRRRGRGASDCDAGC